MPTRIFIALILFLTIGLSRAHALGNPTTSWKEENAKGHYPYHKLIASDFPINDAVHKKQGMYTDGFFEFRYWDDPVQSNGHWIARINRWNVWSGFNRKKSSRKSWFKQIEETLPHEQGHLDLSELHAKVLADMPLDKLPIGEGATRDEAHADLQRKMTAFADRFSTEGQVEQDRYDAETNHGANAAKQREWTASIQSRLQKAGIHF
jgi:hypothetical protein